MKNNADTIIPTRDELAGFFEKMLRRQSAIEKITKILLASNRSEDITRSFEITNLCEPIPDVRIIRNPEKSADPYSIFGYFCADDVDAVISTHRVSDYRRMPEFLSKSIGTEAVAAGVTRQNEIAWVTEIGGEYDVESQPPKESAVVNYLKLALKLNTGPPEISLLSILIAKWILDIRVMAQTLGGPPDWETQVGLLPRQITNNITHATVESLAEMFVEYALMDSSYDLLRTILVAERFRLGKKTLKSPTGQRLTETDLRWLDDNMLSAVIMSAITDSLKIHASELHIFRDVGRTEEAINAIISKRRYVKDE